MPRFLYTATNESGESSQGFLDAESLDAAKAALDDMGLTDVVLKDANDSETDTHLTDIVDPQRSSEEVVFADTNEQVSAVHTTETLQQDGDTTPAPAWQMTEDEPVAEEEPEEEQSVNEIALQQQEEQKKTVKQKYKRTPGKHRYFPILNTLQLYAGWLIALCFLLFALGSYQFIRDLPFSIPYAEGLFRIRTIILFTLGWFLFLLWVSFYRLTGRRWYVGIIFALLLGGVFWLYQLNV